MNIIEAVKSGKRFKRPYWPKFVLEIEMRDPVDGYYSLSPEDLIAGDYEVEEIVGPNIAYRFGRVKPDFPSDLLLAWQKLFSIHRAHNIPVPTSIRYKQLHEWYTNVAYVHGHDTIHFKLETGDEDIRSD